MKGVITGDVVGSTKINDFGKLPKLINDLITEISLCCTKCKVEISRGDSFQVLVEDPKQALLVALLIRAGFRKSSIDLGNKDLDVRLSVGIGEVSYMDEKIGQSNGEAFILSGHGFDNLTKAQRLSVQTFSESINSELKVETAFVDDIVSNWTQLHGEIMYQDLLTDSTQCELAKKLGTSQQNICKRLYCAKEKLVRLYLNRISSLIIDKERNHNSNSKITQDESNSNVTNVNKVTPKTKEELRKLIYKELKRQGPDADLNFIDTSMITDMSELFEALNIINIKIDKWNVSNVTNMSNMFRCNPEFNADLSNWNVSKVTNMYAMFYKAKKFNSNLSKWNVSNVIDMSWMFYYANQFTCNLSKWDVSNVIDIKCMFYGVPKMENNKELQPNFKKLRNKMD
jgi:conserved domain protein